MIKCYKCGNSYNGTCGTCAQTRLLEETARSSAKQADFAERQFKLASEEAKSQQRRADQEDREASREASRQASRQAAENNRIEAAELRRQNREDEKESELASAQSAERNFSNIVLMMEINGKNLEKLDHELEKFFGREEYWEFDSFFYPDYPYLDLFGQYILRFPEKSTVIAAAMATFERCHEVWETKKTEREAEKKIETEKNFAIYEAEQKKVAAKRDFFSSVEEKKYADQIKLALSGNKKLTTTTVSCRTCSYDGIMEIQLQRKSVRGMLTGTGMMLMALWILYAMLKDGFGSLGIFFVVVFGVISALYFFNCPTFLSLRCPSCKVTLWDAIEL